MKARFAWRLAQRMFHRVCTTLTRMRGSHMRCVALAHPDGALDLMHETLVSSERGNLRWKRKRKALDCSGQAQCVQVGAWRILCGRNGRPLDPRTQVEINRDKIVLLVGAMLRRKPDGRALRFKPGRRCRRPEPR